MAVSTAYSCVTTGFEVGVATETAERPVARDECLLDHIFRGSPIAKYAASQVVCLGLVGLDEAVVAIAILGPVLYRQRSVGSALMLRLYFLMNADVDSAATCQSNRDSAVDTNLILCLRNEQRQGKSGCHKATYRARQDLAAVLSSLTLHRRKPTIRSRSTTEGR